MPYPTFENDREYLTNKFRNPVFDTATGEDNETITNAIVPLAQTLTGLSKPVIKAKCFEYVCKHMYIDVNEHDIFPAFGCYLRNQRPLRHLLWYWMEPLTKKEFASIYPDLVARNNAGIHTMWMDFDHSVPDWNAILTLGFPGLRQRARDYRKVHEAAGTLTDAAAAYFDGIELTLTAVLDCIQRFIDFAEERHGDNPRIRAEIEALEQLKTGAPRNFYEVLMIIYLHFMFCEHIDHMQVRSLGNLDDMLLPYYQQDIASGKYTETQIREMIACFFMQWGSINNYWGQPVYFGGTKADGSTKYNELTWILLDVFDKLAIPTPKIQLKVGPSTPDRLFRTACDMIRRGHNSLVFVCERGIKRAMMGIGYTEEEARECDIKGCYEVGAKGAENGTGTAHVNLLKCVELALNDGTDPATGYQVNCPAKRMEKVTTFGEFYKAYLAYLDENIASIIEKGRVNESMLNEVNPSNMFSSTITNSLETAQDAFATGCVYNVSGILLCGIGTTVDALLAVKEIVFEKKLMTLAELRDVLKNNWKGQEKLRLKMLRSKRKYGNGLKEADDYAAAIIHYAASQINGVPNSRGGFFEASGHCAKQYFHQGERTGATPDGRLAGDEFSKNLSPTMGADTNGVTALIQSVTNIDSADLPGDYPLDVMMHPSSVQGEDGLAAMISLIRAYEAKNGIAIHFNIFDASVLEDAQKHPEKYEGLQIRVCGWNTHFCEMDKKEQDAYIERARRISE